MQKPPPENDENPPINKENNRTLFQHSDSLLPEGIKQAKVLKVFKWGKKGSPILQGYH